MASTAWRGWGVDSAAVSRYSPAVADYRDTQELNPLSVIIGAVVLVGLAFGTVFFIATNGG
jgi:hypothetical protein